MNNNIKEKLRIENLKESQIIIQNPQKQEPREKLIIKVSKFISKSFPAIVALLENVKNINDFDQQDYEFQQSQNNNEERTSSLY